MNCPICNQPIPVSDWHSDIDPYEAHGHCDRCKYFYEFSYGHEREFFGPFTAYGHDGITIDIPRFSYDPMFGLRFGKFETGTPIPRWLADDIYKVILFFRRCGIARLLQV